MDHNELELFPIDFDTLAIVRLLFLSFSSLGLRHGLSLFGDFGLVFSLAISSEISSKPFELVKLVLKTGQVEMQRYY